MCIKVLNKAMRTGFLSRKFLALFLLLAIFSARLGALSYAEFVLPLQDYIAQTDFIADTDTPPNGAPCKVKIHSVDVPVPCPNFVFADAIIVTRAVFPPPLEQKLTEGHVIIFIPPA